MLFRKVRRAMWGHKKVYFACVFLIACGILNFVSMSAAVDGLEQAMVSFYDEYRVADIYASVSAANVSNVEGLRNIEGIRGVSSRTVMDVRTEVAGSDKIIKLRLITLDPMEHERINDIKISGALPSDNTDIIVNIAFLEAHNLESGDSITLFAGGKKVDYEVTGSFLSPEYVYVAEDLLPNPEGFGIAYITAKGMEAVT